MSYLKVHNIDVNILVVEVENWVDDEESSNEDQGKDTCLVAHTDSVVTNEESRSGSTFEAHLPKPLKIYKMQD